MIYNAALNPFGKTESIRVPDNIESIVEAKDQDIDSNARLFEEKTILCKKNEGLQISRVLSKIKPGVLEPHKITLLGGIIADNKESDLYKNVFLSRAIQTAYFAGYNDFRVESEGMMDYVACYLKGTEANPIRITIEGDITPNFGYKARYIDAVVLGTIRKASQNFLISPPYNYFGSASKRCIFSIVGDDHFGEWIKKPQRNSNTYRRVDSSGNVLAEKKSC
jgi:hypothetical protein